MEEKKTEKQVETKLGEKERAGLYWLCSAPFLGAVKIRRLGEYAGGYDAVYNMEESRWSGEGGLPSVLSPAQAAKLADWKGRYEDCRRELETMEAEGKIRFVTPYDADYPQRLLELADHPMGLFVRGQVPDDGRPSVSIVGARACSAYGEQLAEAFAKALAAEGVQVVSGLALGIDGAAHRGALKGGGDTYGILGCGVNICYPSAHYGLFEQMLSRGGILSEFPPGTKPAPRNFPIRNRIISGLADAVLVVEAREKSGSLITAELGLEQGKEIFAIPGRVTDQLSRGCSGLIQQGAHLALTPGDLLEYLGVKHQKELILYEKNINGLAKNQKMVYSFLDFKPKHIDEILSETGLGISECLGILLELELGGYAYRSGNHYYGKNL